MMEIPVEVKEINKKLADLYGKTDDGRPYFRLVWPHDQREHRFGDFAYSNGSGLITKKEYNVVRERLKYAHLNGKNRWMLEFLAFPPKPGAWGPELLGIENGSYECVWLFDFKEYRIPNFDAVQGVVSFWLHKGDVKKMSPEELANLERLSFEQEVKDTFDFLDNESPDLAHAIKHGEAVFLEDKDKKNEVHSNLVLSGTNSRTETGAESNGIQSTGE